MVGSKKRIEEPLAVTTSISIRLHHQGSQMLPVWSAAKVWQAKMLVSPVFNSLVAGAATQK